MERGKRKRDGASSNPGGRNTKTEWGSTSHEQIAQNRLWNKRPDGIAFKVPTTTKVGVICLLEFKRMPEVTNRSIVRAKREADEQYESLRSALGKTMQRQGWMVEQISFVAGARSLNEEELKKNLEYFKVPSASIDPIRSKLAMKIFDEFANILKGMYGIRSKLAMKIFDEYANILKGMYGIRFNRRFDHGGNPTRPVLGPTPPLINSLTVWEPNKVTKRKEGEKKERE